MRPKDYDGYLTLALSILLITSSFGITLLLALAHVLRTAIRSHYTSSLSHVVLLGKKLVNNIPDQDYQHRLDRALSISKIAPDIQLYIVGGTTGTATISEARAGRNYLLTHKIATTNIHTEEKSRDTLENMKNLKLSGLIPAMQISMITNRYHLARAARIARGFGFTVELCAAESKYTPGLGATLSLLAESFHLHWYLTGLGFATLTRNQRMLSRIQ